MITVILWITLTIFLEEDLINRKFTINVTPRSKKNHSQIIMCKGRPILIPSKQYKQFENECLKVIPSQYRQKIDYPVNIKALFYMDTRRRVDLTNLLSALDDMLVKAEVVADDCRDIVASHDGSIVYHCKESPRIEIEITKLRGYDQWKKYGET